jgi:hypothetical protein
MNTSAPWESVGKMELLTSEKSISRKPIYAPNSVVLVPLTTPTVQKRFNSRWAALSVCLIASFAGGFGVSLLLRPRTPPQQIRTQSTDFHIVVPDGQTIVTIFNPQKEEEEIGRLIIQRDGDMIQGIPQMERHIAARARLSADDTAFFRRELGGVVLATDSPWQRANKIRSWLVNGPHRVAMPGLATRVPREAYEKMRQGRPVLCGNLAEIYVALCEAAGLTARPVGLSVLVRDGLFGVDTHAAAEIWLPEMGGWVFQDPTFDCYWEIDGKPASALSLHNAVMEGRQVAFAPQSKTTEARFHDNYVDPRLYFRHISYEYKAGGAVLYFADKRLEPLSLTDRNWIQTSDPGDIQRLDTAGNTIQERRAQLAPGIFAQLLGDDLFIRDRREQARGLRVRSSSGTVQGCAYAHQRAEELGLFSGINLARNPSFRLASKSPGIADEWSVAGPVEAMTVAGGQAMAALAGGKLWQRIQVRPHERYLLYARVSVVRGLITWSIGDSARGPQSMGTIEPERISEIVSDVVDSQSGYLDVRFDVPSGGAFRVMDVIVTEAPRFDAADYTNIVR